MRALALVVVALVAVGGIARADYVPVPELIALLPLDAETKLEIYGQPVANEIAKVLRGAGLNVVVVGAHMGVPDETKLIIDGTIATDPVDTKGDAVVLTLRIRNPSDGATLGTVASTASSVTTMDKVVSGISARLLPAVRDKLALGANQPAPRRIEPVRPANPITRPVVKRGLLTAVATGDAAAASLRDALDFSLGELVAQADRSPVPIAPSLLAADAASRTVKDQGTDLGIVLEVARYATFTCQGSSEAQPIPCARARVRVRIADTIGILFDRVIVTDTVVGDRGISAPAFASRVAREVFAILRPNLKRAVPAWR